MIIFWIFLSSPGVFTTAQDYLGCYKSPASDTDALLVLNHASAPTDCVAECKSRYYMYAGLMTGEQCYCLSRYGRDGPSSGCTIPCVTDPNSLCGSHDAMSIYNTGHLAPSPPRRLQVVKNEITSLHITWEPPNIPNGNVTSYILRVMAVETYASHPLLPTQSQIQGGASGSTMLTNLQPGSKYNISITALNTQAESDSISVVEWTLLGPPNKPEMPKVIEKTSSTIVVELMKVNSDNGPVTSYQILVVYPGTIPPTDHHTLFTNYDRAIKDNIPYYITGEFEAADFHRYKKFIIGDEKMMNGYYNAPLVKPFENPQVGLVAVSRIRDEVQYSYSDLTGNFLMKLPRSGMDGTAIVLWIAIVFLSLLLAASVFAYFVLRKRHEQGRMTKLPEQQELTLQGPMYEVDNMAYIPEDVPERPNHYQDLKKKVWSIPKNFLHVDHDVVLKRGRFGTIHKGTVQDKNGIFSNVIVHCISDVSLRQSEKKHMLRDLDVCIKAGSMKYLAGLVGNCETPETLYIVLEAAPENLKNRLLAARSGQVFPFEKILSIGSEIANGLAYLEAHKIIHSHLCARSIGLTNDFTPKIMGFGIGKYSIEDVKFARWTAPERFGHKKHNPAVVWAFGVVLWEMMSMGGTPYSDLEDECDVEEAVVEKHVRLPQLSDMPDPLYEVLLSCWMVDPEERPMFDELTRLNTLSICPITAITEPYLAELELN